MELREEAKTQNRTCMICAESEGYGVTVYPVWSWSGTFMGRWCDWCRELRCWDCAKPLVDCQGTCESDLVEADPQQQLDLHHLKVASS